MRMIIVNSYMTEFINLTELWRDGHFLKVGDIIKREKWSPERVAEFCTYFCKYNGTKQLEILYKFI